MQDLLFSDSRFAIRKTRKPKEQRAADPLELGWRVKRNLRNMRSIGGPGRPTANKWSGREGAQLVPARPAR